MIKIQDVYKILSLTKRERVKERQRLKIVLEKIKTSDLLHNLENKMLIKSLVSAGQEMQEKVCSWKRKEKGWIIRRKVLNLTNTTLFLYLCLFYLNCIYFKICFYYTHYLFDRKTYVILFMTSDLFINIKIILLKFHFFTKHNKIKNVSILSITVFGRVFICKKVKIKLRYLEFLSKKLFFKFNNNRSD